MSRLENASRNLSAIVRFQIINIIMKFGMRTVFVYCLGKEYLGVNGVFSNVLSILSLAELGLGSVIVYDMYKPVAEGNELKLCQYIKFYKKVYIFIGVMVFLMGICLIPFLDVILTDIPNVSNIETIYILFLLKTSMSYFWAEYISLLGVYQMEYISKNFLSLFSIVKSIIESIFLITTHNYIVYLLIDILITIIYNYCIYRKAKTLFPFIDNKAPMLNKEEIKQICKNALGTFSIKFGGTVLGATDNLIISAFVSTTYVGIYSNYDMFLQLILAFTVMIKSAVSGGVGNLCAKENRDRKYKTFQKIYFLYGSIYMAAFVCLLNLLEPFITLWLGMDFHLDSKIVFIAVFNCYLAGMLQPIEIYTYADGAFFHYKWKPWIEAAINLATSILLVKNWGLAGVFIGTTISRIVTSVWFDAYILYRYSFHIKFIEYWIEFFKYLGVTILTTAISNLIINKMIVSKIQLIALAEKALISLGLVVVIWLGIFWRTDELQFYRKIIMKKLEKYK